MRLAPRPGRLRLALLASLVALLPAPPALAQGRPPTEEQLSRATTDELYELAVQVQHATEALLLTPDPALVARHAALLEQPDAGIARLLHEDEATTELGFDGGGRYFSFATREHASSADPDVQLWTSYAPASAERAAVAAGEQAERPDAEPRGLPTSYLFRAGLSGRDFGLWLPLGDVELADVPSAEEGTPPCPPLVSPELWERCWGELSADDAAHGSRLRAWARERGALGELRCSELPATFLLRSYQPRDHDLLVAMRPIARDERSLTFVWRLLRTWRHEGFPESASAGPAQRRPIPDGPSWLQRLTVDELRALLAAIRRVAHERFFAIDRRVLGKHERLVEVATSQQAQAGIGRILRPFRWKPLFEGRGGGAHYRFEDGSNDLTRPDVSLAQATCEEGGRWAFHAQNGTGFLVDLGSVPSGRVYKVFGSGTAQGLGKTGEAAWELLTSLAWDHSSTREPRLAAEQAARLEELGLRRSRTAHVGHLYLLRNGERRAEEDRTYLFYVADENEYGMTLVWRSVGR